MQVRVFAGYDPREAVGYHVFAQSVVERMGSGAALIPLSGEQRDGTNSFSYARFLVPWMCGFQGFAVWCDGSDMLLRGDFGELLGTHMIGCAVAVVKHDYEPRSPRKYVGTPMEAANEGYPRKNWSSLIVWDCGHYMNRVLTPEYVKEKDGSFLHRFGWLEDERVGELPAEWNWLDEYGPSATAKLLHWTNGIAGFNAYRDAPHAGEWRDTYRRAFRGMQYTIESER
jgi:hypothetical protein